MLVEAFPPTTDDGLVSIVESVAGGGGAWGVKLRTADHGPGTPAAFTPRTRQKCTVVARPLATKGDAVTLWLRTSGGAKSLAVSI